MMVARGHLLASCLALGGLTTHWSVTGRLVVVVLVVVVVVVVVGLVVVAVAAAAAA